jgi:hypothetical protein
VFVKCWVLKVLAQYLKKDKKLSKVIVKQTFIMLQSSEIEHVFSLQHLDEISGYEKIKREH